MASHKKSDAPRDGDAAAALRARLGLYRKLSAGLALALAAALFLLARGWVRENAFDFNLLTIDPKAPHADQVKKIIGSLRYSGLPALMNPSVSLAIDFPRREWRLRNLHRFTPEGDVILEEGRFGVCGDLAAYTYQKIRPLFGPGFAIQFARAAETNFFPPPRSSHYVLQILDARDPQNPRMFVLDPSFRRYGPMDRFRDYLFYENTETLPLVAGKETDDVFPAGYWAPIRIRREYIVSLSVEPRGSGFDGRNYAVALRATRKRDFVGQRIFSLGMEGGRRFRREDEALALTVMDGETFDAMKRRITELFEAEAAARARPTIPAS